MLVLVPGFVLVPVLVLVRGFVLVPVLVQVNQHEDENDIENEIENEHEHVGSAGVTSAGSRDTPR